MTDLLLKAREIDLEEGSCNVCALQRAEGKRIVARGQRLEIRNSGNNDRYRWKQRQISQDEVKTGQRARYVSYVL